MKIKKYSLWLIIFIFIFIFSLSSYFNLWKSNKMVVDAPSYYTYLPAAIVYKDLQLNFIDKNPDFFKDKIWYYKIENNKKLIKHPMGVSVLLSPFFILGHWYAIIFNSPVDGYSMPYQNASILGVFFYLFLGLYFLRKLLLNFFSEGVVAITLISIVIGTNLLWYSTFEGLMNHCVSFSMWSICLYAFYNWIKTDIKKYVICFGIAFGFIVLIRPLSVVSIVFFLIYALIQKGGFVGFGNFVKQYFKSILIAKLIIIAIVSLQLFYWKYITGNWFYDVYKDEHFIFSSPQILPFLFSFRKGLFIYTPILIFSVIGIVTLCKKYKAYFYSTIVLLSISIYLLSSWWAWSYGICWGMRPMIDYYAVLSLPFAAGINFLFEKSKMTKYLITLIICLLITLNLFQTWQYKNGLIHYDDMTKEAYFKGLFQTKATDEWRDLLKPYDWDRRIKHLPQINYSKNYFESINEKQKIIFRGSNLKYIGVNPNPQAQNAMASLASETTNEAVFYLEKIKDNKYHIRSSNGYLWSLRPELENVVTATGILPSLNDIFIIEYIDDNKIAIKAANNKYITIGYAWPFIIKAEANAISKAERFRYFVINQ